jgi:prephenate dehydrogenase
VSLSNSTVPFRRVTVVGTGLIGGSFALAVRDRFPTTEIIGCDRAHVLKAAQATGAITRGEEDLKAAVREAELVYVALPIGATVDALGAIASSAPASALVTDSASTKALVCGAAARAFAGGARFLGGHPMAGREKSGVEHARADLFHGARYALIGNEGDADPRVRAFVELLRTIGAEPVWCDAETHDWAVGVVSHLPQMLAVALAQVIRDETDETGMPLALAGSGLKDSLRLAGSPYGVWRDVALTNRENISRALDRLTQAIDHLRTNLGSKELSEEFDAANELYKRLHEGHGGAGTR